MEAQHGHGERNEDLVFDSFATAGTINVGTPYELDYCPTGPISPVPVVHCSIFVAHLGIPDSFGLCLRSGTISNIQSGKHMGEHCEDIGPSLTIIVLALPVLLTSFAPQLLDSRPLRSQSCLLGSCSQSL